MEVAKHGLVIIASEIEDARGRLERAVEPWLGIRADLLPDSVMAIAPVINQLTMVLVSMAAIVKSGTVKPLRKSLRELEMAIDWSKVSVGDISSTPRRK